MKNIVTMVAMTVILAASTAMAADQVVYNAKNGTTITFNHKAHQARTECKACHGQGAPTKIVIEGKQAHALCLDCHKKTNNGKISGACKECHKK